MPRKDAQALSTSNAQAQQDAASEGIDAYELPKSLITRLARVPLPENTKIQKDAVLAMSKGSIVFVNYLAATAHDVALQKQHKSVSASDVLKALEIVEMGDIVQQMQQDLQAYRSNQKGKKGGSAKDKVAQDASASAKAKPKTDPSTLDSATGAKGKEKAVITIPSRTAGQNPVAPMAEADPVGEDEEMRGENDEEMMDAEENGLDAVEDEEPIDEDDEADVGDEPDEIVDEVAMEEKELRRDAKGVEERDHMEEDD